MGQEWVTERIKRTNCLKCEKGPAVRRNSSILAELCLGWSRSGNLWGVAVRLLAAGSFRVEATFQSGSPYTITAPLAHPNGDVAVLVYW